MSYRYDSFTDTFVHIPDEPPNTAVGMGYMPQYILQKQVELTNECIEAIADAVIRKLKTRETRNKSADDEVNASIGKWMLKTFDDGYGEYQLYECDKCGTVRAHRTNYCHNCGARMVKE